MGRLETIPARREAEGSPSAGSRDPDGGAPLGPVVALTVTLALACFAVVAAAVVLLVEPKPLPDFGNLTQRQDAESGLYLAAFGIILPVAVIVAPRLADAIAAGRNRAGLSLVAAALAGTFAASILAARAISVGVGGLLAVVGAWWVVAAALIARARRERPWQPLLRSVRFTPAAWVAAAVLLFGTLAAFASPRSISPVGAALGAIAAVGAIAVAARRETVPVRLPGRWGVAIDIVVVALLLATVPNLLFLHQGAAAGGDQLLALQTSVTQFHQDFYLGPANEVLHGGAMLIDTASQYGVGPIYLLAGWFQLVPIGYGTLGLLDGVLFALLFVSAYAALRVAGVSRLLAASALALAVVVLIYNLLYPIGSLLQHGPLRFGLPMLVILAAAAGARWPQRSRPALIIQAAVVGLSAVWSLEAFAFTLATFAGITWLEAMARPAAGRWGWVARRAGAAAGACVVAHLLFAAATLAAAGQLPDWGQYLAYLRNFLFGQLAELTYDFSRWSAGLPVGAAYLASAAGLFLLVRSRPALLSNRRTPLVALAGTTAYGIALYSYFVNRSADHILPYVCLPAVMVAALWLSLLLSGALAASRPLRLAGLAFCVSVAVLLVGVAWSSVAERFSTTPLAYAAPGGESLGTALGRLRSPAPLDARAPEGERLLSRYIPGDSVPILVSPDLETEILLRSGRANALGLGYAREDSFVASERLPRLQRELGRLAPGDRLLLQGEGADVFATYEADPTRDPFRDPVAPSSLAPLQEWALRHLAQRFELRVVHRDPQEGGFVVASLVPRPRRPGA